MSDDKPNIVSLPTPKSNLVTSDEVLERSKGVFETLVVFGHDANTGVLKCFSNTGDLAMTNLMLDQLKINLVESTFEEIDE